MTTARDHGSWFVAFPVDGSFLEPLPAVPPAFRRDAGLIVEERRLEP